VGISEVQNPFWDLVVFLDLFVDYISNIGFFPCHIHLLLAPLAFSPLSSW
jgi:hypothetical protein